eukprot:INCI7078.4.p1 GENE.INCI7078.4~~INCI7078.4.p1  ORF type:complete len:601 (-),score=65.16 INCI7078.4:516-2318(-)
MELATLQVAFKRRPWTKLPKFFMTNVLSFLPPNELLQHRRVSKAFKRAIQATMASFQPTEAFLSSLERMHKLCQQWSVETFVPLLSAHFYSPYTLPCVLARVLVVLKSTQYNERVQSTETQRVLFRIIAEYTGIVLDPHVRIESSLGASFEHGIASNAADANGVQQSASRVVIALYACHCLVPLVSAVATTSMYNQLLSGHDHCLLAVVQLLLRLFSAAARGQPPLWLETDLSTTRWWCASGGGCSTNSWVTATIPVIELLQLVLVRRDSAAEVFEPSAAFFSALHQLRDRLCLLLQRHAGVHLVLLARIVNFELQHPAGLPDLSEGTNLLLEEKWVPKQVLGEWKRVVWSVPIGELSGGVVAWERVKWSSFDSALSTITPLDFASNCAGSRQTQEPSERAMFHVHEEIRPSLTTDGCLITEDEASSWVLLDFGADARIVLHAVAFDSVGKLPVLGQETETNTDVASDASAQTNAVTGVDWQWPTQEYVIEVSESGQEWDVVLSRPMQTAPLAPRRGSHVATNGAAHTVKKDIHQQSPGHWRNPQQRTIQVVDSSSTSVARYVRLRQTGPNALGSNRLYVRFFRVYGAFYWARERQTRFP